MDKKQQLKRNIIILKREKLINPKYIKTELITFTKDEKVLTWEKATTHDSVHILIINEENNEILLVKQIRIPVFIDDDSQNGVMYEVCAGLVDKNKPLENIAQEEILEEVGYNVKLDKITLVKAVKGGAGRTGHNSYLYYAKVKNEDKVSNGGGLNNEDITVVKIQFDKIEDFMNSNKHTDTTTLFLLTYFLLYKNKILN